MTTTDTIWRWRRHKKGFDYIERILKGRKVPWVTTDHVYVSLGMVKP